MVLVLAVQTYGIEGFCPVDTMVKQLAVKRWETISSVLVILPVLTAYDARQTPFKM